jgi:hypothetical protein
MRWAGHAAYMGEMRNAYNIFVAKPEGKRSFWRHAHRSENNIKMNMCDIFWEGVDWIHLAQDRDQWRAVVNTVMNSLVP